MTKPDEKPPEKDPKVAFAERLLWRKDHVRLTSEKPEAKREGRDGEAEQAVGP